MLARSTAQPVTVPLAPAAHQMTLGALAQRCATENARFQAGAPHDTQYAHELFRRTAPATAPPDEHPRGRLRPVGERRPSGRERHDEKITVYVSGEELLDLEHGRLALRGEHGLVVDRGRIVREALAVVLADLEAQGEQSILVRRLRGR